MGGIGRCGVVVEVYQETNNLISFLMRQLNMWYNHIIANLLSYCLEAWIQKKFFMLHISQGFCFQNLTRPGGR